MDEREVIFDFFSGPEDKVFRVTGAFQMVIGKLGPPSAVGEGRLVRLSKKLAAELFSAAKIEPVPMPTLFEVVREFNPVVNGEYSPVERGDILKLEKAEGLSLWRAGYVLPKEGEDNES